MASKIVFIVLVALALCLFVEAGKNPKAAKAAKKGKWTRTIYGDSRIMAQWVLKRADN